MRGEFLDLSGARLYYYAAGTRGAGVPVVFVHGFATSSHLWADVVPLVPAGHRVVVLDLLGYGRSDRPLARPTDIRAQAARVVELLDELRIRRACIVGHGTGGGIAQSIAIRHPDRVSHLCLVNSVAFDRWPSVAFRVARALLPAVRLLPPEVLVSLVRRELRRGYADADRAVHSIDLYLRPFLSDEGRDALAAHVRGLTNRETTKLGRQLARIAAPTAVIAGQRDRLVPLAAAMRLRDSIKGATLEVIPEQAHFTPEEAPRPVADALAALLRR